MSAPTPAPAAVVDQPSFARLHGEACWHCGAVTRPLTPAGQVTIDDGHAWTVMACTAHQGRPV